MLLEVLFIPPSLTILIGLWGVIRSLTQSWWQGVAGIAQILAAIFAIITISQARKTIKQADEERKRSVRPEWYKLRGTDHPTDHSVARTEIELVNVGRGPAWHPEVAYKPHNENQAVSISGRPAGEKLSVVVLQKGSYYIDVCWCVDRLLDGLLTVTCETQFGDRLPYTFHLKTRTNQAGNPRHSLSRYAKPVR